MNVPRLLGVDGAWRCDGRRRGRGLGQGFFVASAMRRYCARAWLGHVSLAPRARPCWLRLLGAWRRCQHRATPLARVKCSAASYMYSTDLGRRLSRRHRREARLERLCRARLLRGITPSRRKREDGCRNGGQSPACRVCHCAHCRSFVEEPDGEVAGAPRVWQRSRAAPA